MTTDIRLGDEKLENDRAFISRFDTKAKIISDIFENAGRLTNGRFDVHYLKTADTIEED